MKKSLLLIVFAVILGGAAKAQSSVVKFNPLSVLFGNYGAAYEYALNDNVSVGLFAYFTYRSIGIADVKTKTTGFGARPEVRYYFSGDAPSGWYGGAFAAVNSMTSETGFEDDKVQTSFMTIGGGAKGGYQWIFNNNFVVDLFAGAQYITATTGVEDVGFKISGVLPTLGGSIGFAIK